LDARSHVTEEVTWSVALWTMRSCRGLLVLGFMRPSPPNRATSELRSSPKKYRGDSSVRPVADARRTRAGQPSAWFRCVRTRWRDFSSSPLRSAAPRERGSRRCSSRRSSSNGTWRLAGYNEPPGTRLVRLLRTPDALRVRPARANGPVMVGTWSGTLFGRQAPLQNCLRAFGDLPYVPGRPGGRDRVVRDRDRCATKQSAARGRCPDPPLSPAGSKERKAGARA